MKQVSAFLPENFVLVYSTPNSLGSNSFRLNDTANYVLSARYLPAQFSLYRHFYRCIFKRGLVELSLEKLAGQTSLLRTMLRPCILI